jgi:hypothetical protein
MLHPDTELRFISDAIGYGVVATRPIPKGTITWAMDEFDQRFSPDAVERMSPTYKSIVDKYTFRDNQGDYVLCWDHARFINHSFRANCITTAYDFELAVRDIRVGEELTDDYGFLNIDEPFDCQPERGTRRTRVKPDDLLRSHKKWDRLLAEAFRSFADVDQPLLAMLPEDNRRKAFGIAGGTEQMDSILTCYYPRQLAR